MVFIFIGIAAYLLQNFSNKIFIRNFKGENTYQNVLSLLFTTLIFAVINGISFLPTASFILSIVYGICYFGTIWCLVKSFNTGVLGIATIICNMGRLLSTFFGIIVYHNKCNIFTIIGMILMLTVMILSSPLGEKSDNKKGYGWFFFALGSAAFNGILGIINTVVTTEYKDVSSQKFLLWGFVFATIVGAIFLSIEKSKTKTTPDCIKKPKKWALCSLGCAVGNAGGNFFIMKALETGTSSGIVFPVQTGLLSLLLWGMSYFVFKEVKATPRNLVALFLCIAGIILISI